MKRLVILFAAVAASIPAAVLTRQASVPRGGEAVPIVEVIGCLSQGPKSTWVLTSGTEPAVSKTPNTTAAAVKEAGGKRLGARQYSLLGAGPFAPETLKGQRVAVKGVLIAAAKEHRINVTSLQGAGSGCGAK